MKKEFLLLFTLISFSIIAYLALPFSQNSNNDDIVSNKKLMSKNEIDSDITVLEENIELKFDIVRINPSGDVIIAGKTSPKIKVHIFDGNEELASVLSDLNGEWVWMSSKPVKEGIKRFNLKSFKNGKEFTSFQNVILLKENNSKSIPKIIKFTENSGSEILNNNEEVFGLSLDLVEFHSDKKIKLSGRTIPNTKVDIIISDSVKTNSVSDKLGNWSLELSNLRFSDYKIELTTNIENQSIKLKTHIFQNKIQPEIFVERKIVVQNGNSLWRIARKTLGGGIFYSEIYKNNLKIIKNPNLIYPGQVFNLPKIQN